MIVQFLCGDASDELIKTNAKAVNKRAIAKGLNSHVVSLPVGTGGPSGIKDTLIVRELRHELKKLTHLSRLYIQGHGDWQSQKVANWGPQETANCLVNCGMPEVDLISILACEAARDQGTANNARLGASCNSFASKFHAHLKEEHKIKVVVYARIYWVAPIGRFAANTSKADIAKSRGRKATYNEDNQWDNDVMKRAGSKIRFKWEDGQQVREVVDYA